MIKSHYFWRSISLNNIKLPYKVKRKYPFIIPFTILSFVMLAFALICLFSPFIPFFSAFTKSMQKTYMLIGGICTPFFAFVICYSILNIVSPSIAFTVTEKGFTDHTMADGGVGFVPANAIISLKLFGNKRKQFLGIRLDTGIAGNFGKTKKSKQEIQNNIESGMPAIIIRECDLKTTVRNLLDIMLAVYGQEAEANDTEPEQTAEVVNVPTFSQEEAAAVLNNYVEAQSDDDILEIISDSIEEGQALDNDSLAIDDVPLTMDFDTDKPHITNIDDLLSHILDKRAPDANKDDEK